MDSRWTGIVVTLMTSRAIQGFFTNQNTPLIITTDQKAARNKKSLSLGCVWHVARGKASSRASPARSRRRKSAQTRRTSEDYSRWPLFNGPYVVHTGLEVP